MKKNAVITGGTKGIGKALVEKFAAHDFDIITCARNREDLENLRRKINKKFPSVNLLIRRSDLSLKSEINDFTKFIISNTSHVDILINNTGVFLPGAIHEEPDGHLETMINTNLYSAYYLTRGLLRQMMHDQRGHIFNMCSIASLQPYANGGSYSISKYALYGMTKVLREELKQHGIRVTAILPGATFTPSWEGANLPEDRFIKPMDVADAVFGAYQLSPQAVVEDLLIRPQLGDI